MENEMTARVKQHLKAARRRGIDMAAVFMEHIKAATRRGIAVSLRLEEYVLTLLFHVVIEWVWVHIVKAMEKETTTRIMKRLKAAAMENETTAILIEHLKAAVMENETTARLVEHLKAAARRIDGLYLLLEQQVLTVLFLALIELAMYLLMGKVAQEGHSIFSILCFIYLASLLLRYAIHSWMDRKRV